MISAVSRALANHTVTVVVAAGVGFGLAASVPAVYEATMAAYDTVRPVVTDWRVAEHFDDAGDLVISGTMIKRRDCLFMPPILARDSWGRNVAVESRAPTAGKTWDASADPQRFGPWRVRGGTGRSWKFILVYMCSGNRPTIVELGVFP